MLRVRLTGVLELELDGELTSPAVAQRPWAVFAYLAWRGRPVPRGELAGQFWPDVLDQSARASLRSALWALRRRLGDVVEVHDDRVGLSGELWVDVAEVRRLAAAGRLEQALALCRGELLEGLDDEWAIAARERHRELVVGLLERLASAAAARGDAAEAIAQTRRQVDCDPFDEAAHRRLIERLAAAGDNSGALRCYRLLVERLRRELGVSPARQTRELIERLRAGGSRERAGVSPERGGGPPERASAALPRRAGALGATPLLGRERELATLAAAWEQTLTGRGAVVMISGEAGIGKTRLASELAAIAAGGGALVAVSGALDLGGAAPLSLWAELIRELVPELAPPPAGARWPVELAALSSELPAGFAAAEPWNTVAPDLQRTRLFEAVVALVTWASRTRPLLLILEDVHTADEPSLELLGYVARRTATLPVTIVLTRRPLPSRPAVDRLGYALRARELLRAELELDALAAAPTAQLARAAAELTDAQVEQVVEVADGNPLLAVETARALARGLEGVASSLRGSVRATLAALDGDVRALIEVVAVAGRAAEPGELGRLALADPDDAAVRALQTGLLGADDGRLGFAHALLREAVLEELPAPRRRAVHERWARALLDAEAAGAIARPAEAARHLRLAGSYAEAVPQLARAALEARSVAALDEAASYLEEAVAIAPAGAALWLELGEVESWRGRRPAAERAFDRAIALLADAEPLALARAWLRKGRAYHGPICFPAGVRECSLEALALLDRSAHAAAEERREALAALAWAEAVAGSAEEAERLLMLLGSDRGGGDLATYDVSHARALTLMRRGEFVASYAASIAAGEAAGRAGRPDLAYGCWANVAGAAAVAGELERALEFLDRGDEAIAGQGLQSMEVQMLGARSFVLRRLGRLDDALAACAAQRELAERLGSAELVAIAAHDRGLVELASGELTAATRSLTEALGEAASVSRPLTRLALAEAFTGCGEHDRAEQELRECALEPLRPSDFPAALVPRLTRVQGLIALGRGDRAQARRRFAEARAGWERVLDRLGRAESMSAVLADLGRPVVGLLEPERELAQVIRDLEGVGDAVVS